MVPRPASITIEVCQGDALQFESDVLAIKFAQQHYGVDRAVANALIQHYPNLNDLLPKVNGFRLLESRGSLGAPRVLFVGVKALRDFGYSDVREFGRKVLVSLAGEAADVTHVAMTLHGASYGLDESEAFESEVAGLIDAITSGDVPRALCRISIVENNPGRAHRLKELLGRLITSGQISTDARTAVQAFGKSMDESLRSVGYTSAGKPFVFVAMPFAESMDDVFHYGIRNAVKDAGLLCERADLSTFTGDVLDWVRRRIYSAALVVADLTAANPNVYLEVGYAWGCGKPTVLVVAEASDLKFDVRGQRCLVYNRSIRTLEEMLRRELVVLAQSNSATPGA